MRKTAARCISISFLLVCVLLCLAACGTKSLDGTWTVKEYRIDNHVIAKEDIASYCGESSLNYNDTTITFSDANSVDVYVWMTGEHHGTYHLKGETIEIYDESGTFETSIPIVNGNLAVELSDNLVMIMEKR